LQQAAKTKETVEQSVASLGAFGGFRRRGAGPKAPFFVSHAGTVAMLRLYNIACYLIAAISLVPWLFITWAFASDLFTGLVSFGWGMGTLVVAGLYLVWEAVFSQRSWRYFRYGDDLNAAGPATLVGIPALLLILAFATLRTQPV
jgi:hypothetical protein